MHKAWPKLLKRITANKVDPVQDKDLVTATRTWFTLYLFEHQLSYGTGRPAVLKEDDSIRHGRALLQHPSAIEDDMRLVSTLELMVIRERVHNALSPSESPIREDDFETLRKADLDFRAWYATWDQAFSQKYEDAGELPLSHIPGEGSSSSSLLQAKPADSAAPCRAVPQRYGAAWHRWAGGRAEYAPAAEGARCAVDQYCDPNSGYYDQLAVV